VKILSIRLEGFMAHADTTIELSPGSNLLRGPNRVGKSCTVRALDWLFFDRGPRWSEDPGRMELLHEGSGYARVTVVWDTGLVISRYRDAQSQELQIGRQKYTSGVRDWPKLITEATGIRRDELASGVQEALNFGFQNDPVFLLGLPPEKVDQALGKLTGSGPLEAAIGLARTDRTRADRAKKDAEARHGKLATEAAVLSALPAVQQLVDSAKALEMQADEHTRSSAAVSAAMDELAGLRFDGQDAIAMVAGQLAMSTGEVSRAEDANAAAAAVREVMKTVTSTHLVGRGVIDSLQSTLGEVPELLLAAETGRQFVGSVAAIVADPAVAIGSLPLASVTHIVAVADAGLGAAAAAREHGAEVATLVEEITQCGTEAADFHTKVIDLSERQTELYCELDNELAALDVCPVCLQPMPKGAS
jgi:hypothetical protein